MNTLLIQVKEEPQSPEEQEYYNLLMAISYIISISVQDLEERIKATDYYAWLYKADSKSAETAFR